MPENNFNNDLPKTNNENNVNNDLPINQSLNTNNAGSQEANKPMIEIPQKYYDDLAAKEREKQELEAQKRLEEEKTAAAVSETNKMLMYVVVNAIIIFISLYLALNKTRIALIVIPISLVVITISTALKYKKESSYPTSIMVGGILVAAITFIMSMVQTNQEDLWTSYAAIAAVVGFLGLIGSNIITKVIYDYKNIKALQTIGYILFFIAIIAVPAYLQEKYHEEFYKWVFNTQVEVEAETESEYVLKTLKQRYGKTFTCGTYASSSAQEAKNLTEGKYDSKIDQNNRLVKERYCLDEQKNETLVRSIAYNEGAVQYIVQDDYLDELFLYSTKDLIKEDLLKATGSKEVDLSLYPEENCSFLGDCADCDEYYENYERETSYDNQYKSSIKLNYTNYLSNTPKEFINENKFKYIISISGTFGDFNSDYSAIVNNVLNRLNNLGYKNTYGYIISIYNMNNNGGLATKSLVYKVKGSTNQQQTFTNPEIQPISANR